MMPVVVRRVTMLLALALGLGAVYACGGGAEEEATAAATADPAPGEEAVPTETTAVRPVSFVGEAARAYTIPGFEHNPHTNVTCSSCHGGVPGHAAHAGVTCLDCHGGVAATALARTTSPAECQACHHRAEPPRDCARCHAAGEITAQLGVPVSMTTAGRARERELRFAHERHGTVACTECHTLPEVKPVRSCTTCHENHHRPDADCTTCHEPPDRSTHELVAHLSCAGSGCHTDATVTALPLTRPVCLVCHREQRDHEPGRECAQCHLVRGEAGIPPADRTHVPTGRRP